MTEEIKEEEKPKTNILEETKQVLEELKKEKEEISKVRDELQQLRSDQILSGTAGGHVPIKEPEPESDVDYMNKVMRGDFNEKPKEE